MPKNSENTEALILSNIHSISPIQFDYFNKIISVFFGPCFGFPLKQTPGFNPWGNKPSVDPNRRKELGQGSFGTAYVGHYRSNGMQCAAPRPWNFCQNRRTVTQELGV